jgi:hypothetical protein
MDPYYRTIEGFIVLLEKEWLTFGHQFARRAGHGANITNPNDSQRSPIFLQFVDSVWQLLQQFPTAFQFNNTFLIALMDNLYSCQYGTFLLDCDRQRKNANIKQHTISFWYHILAMKENYVNPGYRAFDQVLVPAINNLTVTLWNEYYLRFNPFAHDAQQVEAIIKQRMLLRQIVINEQPLAKNSEEQRARSETAPPSANHVSPRKPKKPSKSKGNEGETSPSLSSPNNNDLKSEDSTGTSSGKHRKKSSSSASLSTSSSKKDKKKDKESSRRKQANGTASEETGRSEVSQQTEGGSPRMDSPSSSEGKKEKRERREKKEKKTTKRTTSHKHLASTPSEVTQTTPTVETVSSSSPSSSISTETPPPSEVSA